MRSMCASLVAGTLLITLLSGCVVDDIHQELVLANDRLDGVAEDLQEVKRTNERLDQLEVRLETLDTVEKSLASIDSSLKNIQVSLASVDTTLDGVAGSLQKLDVHLASLRNTINNIDATIPFLSISGDDQEAELESAETTEPTPSATQAEAADDSPK